MNENCEKAKKKKKKIRKENVECGIAHFTDK